MEKQYFNIGCTDLLVRKEFISLHFIQYHDHYQCTGLLCENPKIVAQFQLKQGMVDGIAYTVCLDRHEIVGVYNFSLGKRIDLGYSYKELELSVIDLNDRGDRWEGSTLNGIPFGYGDLYNDNGSLIYSGFYFSRHFSCYGSTFFPDTGALEYVGMFYNGKRLGNGILYDRYSVAIYNGEWTNNAPSPTSFEIENSASSLDGLSSSLIELSIGDCACNSIPYLFLTMFKKLKSLTIGNNSFVKVTECRFSLPSLITLSIGNNSFLGKNDNCKTISIPMDRCCEVSSCPLLEVLTIGARSFLSYSKFILRGLCVDSFIHSQDIPCLRTLSVGSIKYQSNNFCFCNNLELSGTLFQLVCFAKDLSSLESILLGDVSFCVASHIVFSGKSSFFIRFRPSIAHFH